MSTKYYIATNKQSQGPFTLEQLRNMDLCDDTLIWYDGLDEWKKLSKLPILQKQLAHTPEPPVFNEENYTENFLNKNQLSDRIDKKSDINNFKPNNYLAEAIISILFFWPTALIAIYKAVQVNKLYEKGKHYEAAHTALQARNWIIASLIICLVFIIITILI